MKKQILAAATLIALAIGATTSAMAFDDHKAGHGGRHLKAHHAESTHGTAARRSRLARTRNPESRGNTSYRGGFIDLGPLGVTAACGSPSYKGRYCGQGYSVSGWTY
jgi:hypothetical protein